MVTVVTPSKSSASMKAKTQPSAVTVLEAVDGKQPGWRARVHRPDGGTSTLEFEPLGETATGPVVLDGLVAAVLPAVMRAGGTLRVEGPVTRGALRNFTEFAEAWANWGPNRFRRITIQASHVVDGHQGPTDHSALVAWSGSLRSTHILVRHLDARIQAPFTLRGVVRVLGLHPAEQDVDHLRALAPARQVMADLGLPLLAVRTNAAAAGFMDPEIGTLPLVAAALHLVGTRCAAGLHARSWLFTAQQRYPRPGPVLPDLLSGDAFSVRADGGTTTPPGMVREVLQHPTLASVLSDCERSPRHAPPCGRCIGCTVTALALAAAGVEYQGPRLGWMGIGRIPFTNPRRAAEAEAILQEWRGGAKAARAVLAARTSLNHRALHLRATFRWLGAAAGLRPPWPR